MKYALISDIHSNLEAFTAVLNKINKEKVDKIYCAGDIIGYGPNPIECIDLVIKNNIKSVKGNHEELNDYCEECFNNNEILGLNWTKREIISKKKEYIDYLLALPEIISERDIFVVHGSPFDHLNGGIDEKEVDLQDNSYDKSKRKFLVIGHTHKPFIRKIKEGLIINPGSIGQPRDKNWKASFSILNADIPEVKNIRLEYDVDSTIIKMMQGGLPQHYADRLVKGL